MRFNLRAAVLALVLPTIAYAQVFEVGKERESGPRRSPVFGGGSLVYGRPQGSFADYVKQGFGLDGFVRWKLDRKGAASLGLEAGFLEYGRETTRVPLSETVGRILVDVTTSNDIFYLALGPQFTVTSGPIRPYASGGIGFSYFVTRSAVEGSSNTNESFAETTNFDDFVFTSTAAGGVYIPLGRRREAGLDIGVRYHNTGETSYLREGGIIDRPGQTPLINPIRSETKLLSFRVGIVAGIR